MEGGSRPRLTSSYWLLAISIHAKLHAINNTSTSPKHATANADDNLHAPCRQIVTWNLNPRIFNGIIN